MADTSIEPIVTESLGINTGEITMGELMQAVRKMKRRATGNIKGNGRGATPN